MEHIALHERTAADELSEVDRATLLELAHRVVTHGTRARKPLSAAVAFESQQMTEALCSERAAFVSVYIDGELRGCTGELIARRSLAACVAHHAHSAAFLDDRFPQVRADELPRLGTEISVVGLPIPIHFEDEDDLLKKLQPGVDGLTIEAMGRLATFLPKVWESLPDPSHFLDHLKHKAGLPLSPIPGLRATRYGTEVFRMPSLG